MKAENVFDSKALLGNLKGNLWEEANSIDFDEVDIEEYQKRLSDILEDKIIDD